MCLSVDWFVLIVGIRRDKMKCKNCGYQMKKHITLGWVCANHDCDDYMIEQNKILSREKLRRLSER